MAALIPLGYLSSWISTTACEKKTARIVVRALGPGKKFFIRPEQTDEKRQTMWDSVGAVTAFYDASKDGPFHIPRGDLGGAVPMLPFFTSVDYFWIRAPEVGSGGTLWYFCLFGLVIELGHSSTRAS